MSVTYDRAIGEAIRDDIYLARAIAIIHVGHDFARWQRAFRVLRKIKTDDSYAAALDVVMYWGES
jgi:hypothetical protein